MKRIGIISDTHGYWDDKYLHYFESCDEIWHAGDIGSTELAERWQSFARSGLCVATVMVATYVLCIEISYGLNAKMLMC